MNKEAHHFDYRILVLEETVSWLKRQEFDEAGELLYILLKQCEELRRQRRTLLAMTEALRRTAEKYDRAEQRIIDSQEIYQRIPAEIEAVDLRTVRDRIANLGLRLDEI